MQNNKKGEIDMKTYMKPAMEEISFATEEITAAGIISVEEDDSYL